ncbi:flagellar basal body-associated protein FliL [Bacillus sp. Bva_UNVM-123]|uniref:flagellar basal body-associated protein FliL n=1 Tax=Bacillus sp. Bva_UNVM-123 TaxID=2829798 RepID=UPI00391F423B
MKNNKLITIMIILLVAITLVGTILIVVLKQLNENTGNGQPSIDQILESSVDVEQVTTNLASNDFIRISFKIQTNSKKAKKELEKREFQVKDVVIQELSEMKANEIQGKDGQAKIKEALKLKLNSLMQNGQVVEVYITESLLQ